MLLYHTIVTRHLVEGFCEFLYWRYSLSKDHGQENDNTLVPAFGACLAVNLPAPLLRYLYIIINHNILSLSYILEDRAGGAEVYKVWIHLF